MDTPKTTEERLEILEDAIKVFLSERQQIAETFITVNKAIESTANTTNEINQTLGGMVDWLKGCNEMDTQLSESVALVNERIDLIKKRETSIHESLTTLFEVVNELQNRG